MKLYTGVKNVDSKEEEENFLPKGNFLIVVKLKRKVGLH
jgi:hypothetical protein